MSYYKEESYFIDEQKFSFDEYQKRSAKTAEYMEGFDIDFPDVPERVRDIVKMSYAGLGMGESGEVQGKIKKIIRDDIGVVTDEKREALKGELGDVLWYVGEACRIFNLNMGDVAIANCEKLESRKERGVITGSGDNR